jgi:hypothetical protein
MNVIDHIKRMQKDFKEEWLFDLKAIWIINSQYHATIWWWSEHYRFTDFWFNFLEFIEKQK